MRARPHQLELTPRTWGGRRHVPHRRRPLHDQRCPAHVKLRARSDVPSLRPADVFAAMCAAFALASKNHFRLLHFSVQADHVHLVLEGDCPSALQRGIQGLAIRVARAINRGLGRRGRIWTDRYHARALATPREVRNAVVYVLQNWRKHFPGVGGLDPRSSARWFTGWRTSITPPAGRSPVAAPVTWLARLGWRRHGLVDLKEGPGNGLVRQRPRRVAVSARASE